MSSGLYFIVVLCLTSGLWTEANADEDPCCETCPPGWTKFGSKCYIYHHGPKIWADAELDCVKQKGNLASIHNKGEYDFVIGMIKRVTGKNTRIWVGGHDIAKEGAWQWTDGSAFLFKIFPPRQPDNGGKREHCLELNWNNAPNDVYCLSNKPYMCTMRL